MRPLDFVSLSSKMMKAYEAVCQPVCKRYQLNQTCLDVILFLANNPEIMSEISEKVRAHYGLTDGAPAPVWGNEKAAEEDRKEENDK